jgi:hypothetical protein
MIRNLVDTPCRHGLLRTLSQSVCDRLLRWHSIYRTPESLGQSLIRLMEEPIYESYSLRMNGIYDECDVLITVKILASSARYHDASPVVSL